MAALFKYTTILEQVQNALVTLNQNEPAGVYDSQDGNAVLMGALANEIGPLLAEAYPWQQFKLVFTVTGDGTTTAFALPSGLNSFISNTGWSQTNRRPVQVLNDQQWAAATAWIGQTPFLTPACHIIDNEMVFLAAPASAEEITFDYTTRNWVLDADGTTTKEILEANGDKPMLDFLLFTFALKLKWAEVRGMPTAAVLQDFTSRWNQITGRNQLAPTLYIGSSAIPSDRLISGLNVPDTGFGG